MTTDTALLVSREILEEGKPLASLKFIENPEIPTDDSVKRYLDMAFPIATLASDKFKGQNLATLRTEEHAKKDVHEFEKYCRTQKKEGQDEGENEEFTVMEGFNYRVNDTAYPVYRGDKPVQDFPIIPIGMLDIWRSENDGNDEFF
jgi:hypothetical protein